MDGLGVTSRAANPDRRGADENVRQVVVAAAGGGVVVEHAANCVSEDRDLELGGAVGEVVAPPPVVAARVDRDHDAGTRIRSEVTDVDGRSPRAQAHRLERIRRAAGETDRLAEAIREAAVSPIPDVRRDTDVRLVRHRDRHDRVRPCGRAAGPAVGARGRAAVRDGRAAVGGDDVAVDVARLAVRAHGQRTAAAHHVGATSHDGHCENHLREDHPHDALLGLKLPHQRGEVPSPVTFVSPGR